MQWTIAVRQLDDQYGETDQPSEPTDNIISDEPKLIGLNELTELVSALQRKVALLERNKGNLVEDKSDQPSESVHRGSDVVDENDVSPSVQSVQAGSPVYAGPTSSNFSLGLAKIILEQDIGAKTAQFALDPDLADSASCWEEEDDENEDESRQAVATSGSCTYGLHLHDALRLLQVYHECVGVLHPIVDMELLVQQCKTIWQPPQGHGQGHHPGPEFLEDQADLKLVLAIALLAEGGGSNATATKIHNDVQPAIASQMLAKNFTLQGQILLLLGAFYQVFQDDNRLASRYVAIACRLMIEAGLHQRHFLLQRFTRKAERAQILTILSTCLILDRQLNFNAGLPFTLKDTDVDIPEVDALPAYVQAMAAYARIGPPAWAAMTDERGRLRPRIRDEDFDYLDYQVRCWQDNLPVELRPQQNAKQSLGPSNALEIPLDRGTHLLRYILYLRANQFKIVILRPLLFSAQTVRANIKRVKALTHIANDTIETITEMNASYDLYRKQQPILNVFLSSALSTLFLIHIHGLTGQKLCADELSYCSGMAREGINRGLAIIRAYSSSRSSQRLWKKFAGQHGLLSRLGFASQDNASSGTTASLESHSIMAPLDGARHISNDLPSIPWVPVPLAGYPPLDGFDTLNQSRLPPSTTFDDYSPLPVLGMSPFLMSNDVNLMYNDLW
ncbi:hypothetical protein H2200_012337 [Cladophialophora chaetospira]|uniref:Xylanolytic transcriptional activator regulatory domain-containing protein n=1 Tax=Cladophialophora chaetospira TaxID=386627 RepID=A0AA38WXQ6_9EURO|nr:hypothetical protein H2200_012337 [Cladophialophora chaetospira]